MKGKKKRKNVFNSSCETYTRYSGVDDKEQKKPKAGLMVGFRVFIL